MARPSSWPPRAVTSSSCGSARSNGTAATPLRGTEGANGPFFSPDGTAIGFWVGRTLKRVPASGGPPVTIAEVDSLGREAATWSSDGHIYVQTNDDGGRIARVPAAGGTLTDVVVRDPAKAARLLLPHVLPDGKRLLLTMMKSQEDWETAAVVIRSLDGGDERVLVPNGSDARYVPTGHILYMKTGTLMAVPFDLGSGQVTGAPVALIEGVMQAVNLNSTDIEGGAGQFAVSNTGTLIYATGGVGAMRLVEIGVGRSHRARRSCSRPRRRRHSWAFACRPMVRRSLRR